MWQRAQDDVGMSMDFVANFINFHRWKKFDNWLRFDKVTESLKVGTFFKTQCTMYMCVLLGPVSFVLRLVILCISSC